MRITALQISDWAQRREAQSDLPRLVRRLVHRAATTTAVAIPSGETITYPGWDGAVLSEGGSAWIPKGSSRWEMSCNGSVGAKATADYAKRTAKVRAPERSATTFVFVSPRRWPGKEKWAQKKRSENKWADVRAFDADDLEQWLEQTPAVALAFGEELGLIGPGVETPARAWDIWALQSQPSLTHEAVFAGREPVRQRLAKELLGGPRPPISLTADSVAEAVAFACAVVLDHGLADAAVVVTHEDGWRYVKKNPQLRVAVAGSPEIATRIAQEGDLIIVTPVARGDLGASRDGDSELRLERPDRQMFEDALGKLGIEQSDAERLSQTSGRSWSVIRRQRAGNSAIRRPAWLANEHAWVLSTLCLVSSWVADNETDQQIIADVAGKPYEHVERALAALAEVDDSPVLRIGPAWKAKAPIELLDLFGARITAAELRRYFAQVHDTLLLPDPMLELPDEKRHAAAIYGKVRPHSGLMRRALADSLPKLAVRGILIPELANAEIEQQVSRAVRKLLRNADSTQWLSLDGSFRPLAEAAPDAFLSCIVESFAAPSAPVTQLIKETSSPSVFGGQCWQADLLWALEVLAWSSQHLTRTSLILAKLTHVETKSTWNNSPLNTLVDIYRAWRPQTAATVQQRLRAIDTLSNNDPEVTFKLLDKLVYTGSDTASPSARPRWRDDDAGAGYATTHASFSEMYLGAADRLIRLSAGNSTRLAALVEKVESLDASRGELILSTLRDVASTDIPDQDRETLRAPLREKLHWHRNYDQQPMDAVEKQIAPLQQLYDALLPKDLTIRHGWLFSNGWPDPRTRVRDEGFQGRQSEVDKLRTDAAQEIYAAGGLDALESLARQNPHGGYVGWAIAKLGLADNALAAWAVSTSADLSPEDPMSSTVSGLLFGTAAERRLALLDAMYTCGLAAGWNVETAARLLAVAPHNRALWDFVESKPTDLASQYWQIAFPGFIGDDAEELQFVARKLLAAKRPRSALAACRFNAATMDHDLLATLLERMLAGDEMTRPLPKSWDVQQMLAHLQTDTRIEQARLIRLEFGLIPALGYEHEGAAKTLYGELLSDPAFFVELLKLVFRPATAANVAEPSEGSKATAEIAYRVLMHCKRVPGHREDGIVDEAAFSAFTEQARVLAIEADRRDVFDSKFGEILAYAPQGSDGVWPFKAARDFLDRPELDHARDGLTTGLFNKRGMVSKSYAEGGRQERDLAAKYRGEAQALHQSHPLLAAALDILAARYEAHGRSEDIEARLRLEGE